MKFNRTQVQQKTGPIVGQQDVSQPCKAHRCDTAHLCTTVHFADSKTKMTRQALKNKPQEKAHVGKDTAIIRPQFETAMSNTLKAVMTKVTRTENRGANVSSEMEILRQKQKETLKIKNIVTSG